MKIYELNSVYDEEIDEIWRYITEKGKPRFGRERVRELWERFSEELFCAGFIQVSDVYLIQFVYWLCEVEE